MKDYSENNGWLVGKILELPKSERLVLVLYYSEDLTLKEISEVLKLTEQQIKLFYSHALWTLRNCIKKKNGYY